MRRLVISLALLAVPALAHTAPAHAAYVTFQTPSGNIACAFSTGGRANLRCDVLELDAVARKPASCELDYGHAFAMTGRSRARRICHGDTVRDPGARVLPYDVTRRYGPFSCRATSRRLRCVNRADHGFKLARESATVFSSMRGLPGLLAG